MFAAGTEICVLDFVYVSDQRLSVYLATIFALKLLVDGDRRSYLNVIFEIEIKE